MRVMIVYDEAKTRGSLKKVFRSFCKVSAPRSLGGVKRAVKRAERRGQTFDLLVIRLWLKNWGLAMTLAMDVVDMVCLDLPPSFSFQTLSSQIFIPSIILGEGNDSVEKGRLKRLYGSYFSSSITYKTRGWTPEVIRDLAKEILEVK